MHTAFLLRVVFHFTSSILTPEWNLFLFVYGYSKIVDTKRILYPEHRLRIREIGLKGPQGRFCFCSMQKESVILIFYQGNVIKVPICWNCFRLVDITGNGTIC